MGKFDGILLCSDLDETLLTDKREISKENKSAIEYFMKEGGLFTFATGRVPIGAKLNLKYVVPNVPMICFNGAGIYDFNSGKIVWERFLDDKAGEVVEYVMNLMPKTGVEICTNENNFYLRTNRLTKEHLKIEGIREVICEMSDIKEAWKKVIFMAEKEDMPSLRELIRKSPYFNQYSFIQSFIHYYELLPKNVGKGEAVLELAKMYGILPERTIGVGDNENDLSLIKLSGVGIAVQNARADVKESADYITVSNNEHALARIIYDIENGKIML